MFSSASLAFPFASLTATNYATICFLASLALTTPKRGAPCLALDCHVLVASSVLTFCAVPSGWTGVEAPYCLFQPQGLVTVSGRYVRDPVGRVKRIEIGKGSNKNEIHATKK